MPQKNTLQENGSSAAIFGYLSMTKFPWKLKYVAKYILKAFFLTTFPSTQKKCPKIYAVTLVLPLKGKLAFIVFLVPLLEPSRSLCPESKKKKNPASISTTDDCKASRVNPHRVIQASFKAGKSFLSFLYREFLHSVPVNRFLLLCWYIYFQE